MPHPLTPICVYCGAAWGVRDEYRTAARAMGAAMAARSIDLVYGGGRLGIMREIADAALEGEGHVLGVITHDLKHKEVAHDGVSRLEVVETMHQRKKLMADTARAFIALPGGVGTMDELFEILAWAQLGIHKHPVGVLNVRGFFDPLIALMRHMAAEGFLRIQPDAAMIVESNPDKLLDRMERFTPTTVALYEQAQQRA